MAYKPKWTKQIFDINEVPAFMTVEEVCQLLRISDQTVRNMINAGDIKAFRVGHTIRIPKESIIGMVV